MRATDITWAGGEHAFMLNINMLRALQDRCDAGPQFILERLSSRRWHVNDVTETIRLGLEGGGMPKEAARRLVQQYVEDRPLTDSVMTAMAVLTVALYGSEDDQPGEGQAGAGNRSETHSRAENGGSPPFTSGPG